MPLRHLALGGGKKLGARDLEVVGPRVLAARRHHHVAIELGHEVILFQLSAGAVVPRGSLEYRGFRSAGSPCA